MCTLSIISLSPAGSSRPGFRLVASRDEDRTRPSALVPRWRPLDQLEWNGEGATRAIWPTDPKGGGTWVAAGDTGLVLCLLNLNLEPPPRLPPGLVSRGAVIPRLIGLRDAERAMSRLEEMELERFAPFRMVAVDLGGDGAARVIEARWDREELTFRLHPALPLCLVSSGLGDSRALPRLGLFDEMSAGESNPEVQDRFHNHRWPDRPEISVLMSRPEARTVSITAIEVLTRTASVPSGVSVRMSYRPIVSIAGDFAQQTLTGRQVAASGSGV